MPSASLRCGARPVVLGLVAAGAVVSLTACGLLPGRGDPPPDPAENAAEPPADEDVVDGTDGTTEEDIDAFDIEVGDCLIDDSFGDTVREVPVGSCDEPHSAEAFHSHILADGDWPGDTAIDEEASEVCRTEFAAFIGIPYEESIYGVTWFKPTEESWETIDDREVLCLVDNFGEPITGSLAGVAQ